MTEISPPHGGGARDLGPHDAGAEDRVSWHSPRRHSRSPEVGNDRPAIRTWGAGITPKADPTNQRRSARTIGSIPVPDCRMGRSIKSLSSAGRDATLACGEMGGSCRPKVIGEMAVKRVLSAPGHPRFQRRRGAAPDWVWSPCSMRKL